MHHAAYPAYDLMLLRDSPKMSKMVTACAPSQGLRLPSLPLLPLLSLLRISVHDSFDLI